MNVTDILAEHARDRADHPAIEDGDRVVTYAELDASVSAAAANLLEAGIEEGDFVGVMLSDSADHIVLLCALAKLGAVTLAIDGELPRRERDRAFEGFDLKAVIAEPDVSPVEGPPFLSLQEICDGPKTNPSRLAARLSERRFDGERALTVMQSSGTTGRPKRLLLNHAQFISRFKTHTSYLGLTSSDRWLLVVRMTFSNGYLRCLMMLHLGATVIVNRARSVKQFLTSLNERKITQTFLTPAHLRPLIMRLDCDSPLAPSVRILVGASVLFPEERRRVRRYLTPGLVLTYGANEAGQFTFSSPAHQDAHPDSIGRLIAGIEAQVVDEQDRPLSPGTVGLIRFRGPHYPTAYYNDAEATARHFRDGWFYPGDLAAINEEGYVFLKGRSDDSINNSGVNFYPIEVESALMAHPHVAEAAVFGWPHAGYGEVAVAVVVTTSPVTGTELAAFCRQRIAGFKIPRLIGFVPRMPKNAMGKIVKSKLKDISRQKLPSQFS